MKYLLMGIGGAAGTILRYYLVSSIQRDPLSFPWGTFTVNISGSLIIGLIAGFLLKESISEEWRLFIFVGLLGGFTTFSSLAIETVNLFRAEKYFTGLTYLISTNVTGVLLALAGFHFARRLAAY